MNWRYIKRPSLSRPNAFQFLERIFKAGFTVLKLSIDGYVNLMQLFLSGAEANHEQMGTGYDCGFVRSFQRVLEIQEIQSFKVCLQWIYRLNSVAMNL
jgi:hypothetical protein